MGDIWRHSWDQRQKAELLSSGHSANYSPNGEKDDDIPGLCLSCGENQIPFSGSVAPGRILEANEREGDKQR